MTKSAKCNMMTSDLITPMLVGLSAWRRQSLYGLKSVNVAGAVIPLLDKINVVGDRATLDANLTMGPHIKALSSSCTMFVLSGKFVHHWMIARLSLLHLHLFLCAWIS